MHIHTIYSDGRATPEEVLLYARDKGLRIIAITDHDSFQGALAAKHLAEKQYSGEVLVVVGNEVRTDKGDVLVYCYEPFNTPRELGLLIDKAHENNCLVVPAHPFDVLRLGIGEYIYEYSGWDAVEVWNASASKGANRKAIAAARELGLPGLANSDAHIPEYIGVAHTLIDVEELSIDSVFKAIRENKVKPRFGYPPFKVFMKRIAWSMERVFRKRLTRG